MTLLLLLQYSSISNNIISYTGIIAIMLEGKELR